MHAVHIFSDPYISSLHVSISNVYFVLKFSACLDSELSIEISSGFWHQLIFKLAPLFFFLRYD